MTDLQRMKKGQPKQTSVSFGNADTAVVPFSADRVSLILCSSKDGVVWWSWDTAAVAGQGIATTQNGLPIELSLWDNGAVVKGPVRAIAPGGNTTVSYIEVLNTES